MQDIPVTRSLNATIGSGIGAIAVISLASGLAALVTAAQLRHAIAVRDQSAEINRALATLQIAMLDQETGLRGFLLTGDRLSLQPYRDGAASFEQSDAQLHALVAPDSAEGVRLAEADTAAHAWQRAIAAPVLAAATEGTVRRDASRQLETDGTGRAYFDRFRAAVKGASDAARERRRVWDRRLIAAAAEVAAAIGAGIMLTIAICVAVSVAIRRTVTRPLLALAEAMRRLAARDLTVEVPEQDSRSEVGAMARAVGVFKRGLEELDRTSVLRAMSETLPALVAYIDAGGRARFLNGEFARAFALGSDSFALQGRPVRELVATFPGAAQGALEAALAGAEQRFEHRLLRPGTGEAQDFAAFFRPHLDGQGHVLGVVTLLTDITERKRLGELLALQAADLARSNEELEQFAYVASHDLKAPLRGIENLVTWIEEDLGALVEGGVRENMDLLRSRVHRLERLLDDLLAYSRAGQVEAQVEAVDVAALVSELAGLVSPPAGFTVEAAPGLGTITTWRVPLAQALQNLIGNAIKHHDAPERGHVWVRRGELGDGLVTFTVEDDGPGIAPQFRERVFGMFQTLRPRDEVEGSGMGLAIVRKLVDRQGGTVALSDRTGGRGLAVHFTWPDAALAPPDRTRR